MPKAGLKHHEPTTSLYRRGTWLFFLQEVFLQQVLHFRCKSRNPAGITFICKECERGSAQASGASVACEPCPFGQYADEPGSLSCKVCPVDWYQDQKGEHGCKRCPEGTGTRLLGSVSITDCGCYERSINIAANGAFQCVPCGEGLDCPFASTIEHLTSAVSHMGQVAWIRSCWDTWLFF